MVNVCVWGGGGGERKGVRKSYQPGVYVPLKALFLVKVSFVGLMSISVKSKKSFTLHQRFMVQLSCMYNM